MSHLACTFLLARCCCSLLTTSFDAETHRISKSIAACTQHIKAAMLIGGSALSIKTNQSGHNLLQLNLLLQHAHMCCCCRLTRDARMMGDGTTPDSAMSKVKPSLLETMHGCLPLSAGDCKMTLNVWHMQCVQNLWSYKILTYSCQHIRHRVHM